MKLSRLILPAIFAGVIVIMYFTYFAQTNDITDTIVDVIQKSAHTGNPGDGKIFVVDVKEVVKIRTNERGEDAIRS